MEKPEGKKEWKMLHLSIWGKLEKKKLKTYQHQKKFR